MVHLSFIFRRSHSLPAFLGRHQFFISIIVPENTSVALTIFIKYRSFLVGSKILIRPYIGWILQMRIRTFFWLLTWTLGDSTTDRYIRLTPGFFSLSFS